VRSIQKGKSHVRKMILTGLAALCTVAVVCIATAPSALAKAHSAKLAKVTVHDPVVYDSIIDPNPGNVPSLSFEAHGVLEVGNQVSLGGTARVLNNVVVQMSSWACESGSWTGTPSPCASTPGDTFSVPITLNLYNVGPANSYGPSTVGSLIATATQTFNIPYRPSADPVNCPATPTKWYDAGLATCFNGFFNNIDFNFGHAVLPDHVIYGITYNTNTSGFSPTGIPGPADSLNVAMSTEPVSPSVGSDDYPGTVYMAVHDGGYESNYCDGGAAGIGVFRVDEPTGYPANNGTNSGCWGSGTPAAPWSIPAVQLNTLNSPSPSFSSSNTVSVVAGVPGFSFTVTTTGAPTPSVQKIGGKIPKGLSLTSNPLLGTATLAGTALTTDHNGTYTIILRARNGKNSVAKQHLLVTVTGGH